ncbi:MAG: hypothetical protein NZ876_10155 [Dehalococcoidia bacterium]|nr:hypothetical protein [Dehalococcoidia bacterium]
MSTRLGIELVVEPAFTARAYRTRNIVCGQYGTWAAEMQMLRMSLVSYFECPDTVVDLLAHGVGQVAEASRKGSPRFSINHRGVAMGRNDNEVDYNSIYLDFEQSDSNHPLNILRRAAVVLVEQLPEVTMAATSDYRHKINLMEHANLPKSVMDDALCFAKEVSVDVGVPEVARAWRLVLLRYHSESAGDDWSNGSWASDISWEYLSSHVL